MNDAAAPTLRKMIRLDTIVETIGVARSTIYRWMERDQFPKPVNLGDRVISFYEDEVLAWQKKREEQSTAPPDRRELKPLRPRGAPRKHPR
jgi:prophage regulatory protein